MSKLFNSLCFKNGNKVELIVDGEIVPVTITDLEEEHVSYTSTTKIRLTGTIDYCAFTRKVQSVLGVTNCTSNMAYKKAIFNAPATIVIWNDGSKTVVTCQKGDEYDPEKGLALCFMKKALGNKGNFNNILKAELPKSEE